MTPGGFSTLGVRDLGLALTVSSGVLDLDLDLDLRLVTFSLSSSELDDEELEEDELDDDPGGAEVEIKIY